MNFSEIYKITLALLLIVCAVSVNLTRSLLRSVIIFMSYSSIMCLLWILMESPDLAITEAAVGAGISGYLFLVTLKKLRQIDGMEDTRQHDGGAQDAGRREGAAWTQSAPDGAASQIPDGVTAQTLPDGVAAPTFPDGVTAQTLPDGVTMQTTAFPDGAKSRNGDGKRKRRQGGRKEGGR